MGRNPQAKQTKGQRAAHSPLRCKPVSRLAPKRDTAAGGPCTPLLRALVRKL